ncbi:unnamed protein product [Thelazia callipaeda]|uniref:Uncharacterized protein n=1 Tax=Thelazia callipaeda TaxID=103827 RepID=A0A0N5D589_THECL|nr:unnamed protein product [Thelazia callipaeda]
MQHRNNSYIWSRRGIHSVDSTQEKTRKYLIRSAPLIRREQSSGDQHSRIERTASAARMPEYDPAPESIMKKRGITIV